MTSVHSYLDGGEIVADRAGVRANSLLSGNLTGNFLLFGHPKRSSDARNTCAAAGLDKLTGHPNSENVWLTGNS
jgi:hypothetical protein